VNPDGSHTIIHHSNNDALNQKNKARFLKKKLKQEKKI